MTGSASHGRVPRQSHAPASVAHPIREPRKRGLARPGLFHPVGHQAASAVGPHQHGTGHRESDHPNVGGPTRCSFAHDHDIRIWRDCLRLLRTIIAQPALDRFRGEEVQPGPDVAHDDQIDRWVRQHAESAYHPACTCRMGDAADPDAVVDPDCRVRGVNRLRVVDASVIPRITNGNLNAPTIMVAERAADMILGEPLLAGGPWSTRCE